MNVMWFMAAPSALGRSALEGSGKHLYGSGNWIDDEARVLVDTTNFDLVEVFSAGNVRRSAKELGVTYCDLGIGRQGQGRRLSDAELTLIDAVLNEFKPDLVMVWGTETSFSSCVLKIASMAGIPTILCPQGLIASLCHYPNGLVPAADMCGLNPFNWLKMPLFNQTQRAYCRQLKYEREAISSSSYILSDNDWTFDYCRCINDHFKELRYALPLNCAFWRDSWELESSIPFTIMTVSPRSSYKGQHILLKAVARMKTKYPELKVAVPATRSKMSNSITSAIKETPYVALLKKIIRENSLEDNVIFLDRLSPEELADFMRTCRVFVNPSVIESNCMSLREAMSLGMPVVSSFAGSIQEYVRNGENGYLYRYEEDEVLSSILCRLFENNEDCKRIGANARSSMEELYSRGESLGDIYVNVVQECHVK